MYEPRAVETSHQASWTDLPCELCVRILENTSYSQRVQELPLVSKRWRDDLGAPSSAWKDVYIRLQDKNWELTERWLLKRIQGVERLVVEPHSRVWIRALGTSSVATPAEVLPLLNLLAEGSLRELCLREAEDLHVDSESKYEALAQLTSLETLHMDTVPSKPFRESGVAYIALMTHLRDLELGFIDFGCGDPSLALPLGLSVLTALTSLSLSCCYATPEAVDALCSLQNLKRLRLLAGLTGALGSSFRNLTKLQSLDLRGYGHRFRRHLIYAVTELPASLQQLHLSSVLDPSILTPCTQLTSLGFLDFKRSVRGLRPAGLEGFRSRLRGLQGLEICVGSTRGVAVATNFASELRALKSLRLKIDDAVPFPAWIAELYSLTGLDIVGITDMPIGPYLSHMAELTVRGQTFPRAALRQATALRALDFSARDFEEPLDDADIEVLAGLPKLRVFSVQMCGDASPRLGRLQQRRKDLIILPSATHPGRFRDYADVAHGRVDWKNQHLA